MRHDKFPKIIFAGDREISARVLKFILKQGCRPCGLILPEKNKGACRREVLSLCKYLNRDQILNESAFKTESGKAGIRKLAPDYIICIHFPGIVPHDILRMPSRGVLNLHPAYLPYNRGYHTSTWAIIDETVHGATLHFMNEGIDTGDIVYQKQIEVSPDDTADTLSKKTSEIEYAVFKETWPMLVSDNLIRKKQSAKAGSSHRKKDIAAIQQINLDQKVKAEDLIKRLRALTTNDDNEAAYFKQGNRLYRVGARVVCVGEKGKNG